MGREATWLPATERAHRVAFAVIAWLGAAYGALGPAPSIGAQIGILGAAVIVFALPHGAVDPWVAARLGTHRPRTFQIALLASYVGLAAAVFAAWSVAPVTSLVLFLAISVWHFGRDANGSTGRRPIERWTDRIASGATPVLAPLLLRREETLGLFSRLLDEPLDPAATGTALGLDALVVGWLALWLGTQFGRASRAWHARGGMDAREILASVGTVAAFATLPVLLAFGLYFCLDHSMRHGLRVAWAFGPESRARALRRYLCRAAPLTILSVFPVVVGAQWVGVASSGDAAFRTLFIGLAALTWPHVLLSELLEARGGRYSSTRAPSTPSRREAY
ncbi:MAG: Brp/Blh family beta-carotene 15,15'-dioxygenase [bacterium]